MTEQHPIDVDLERQIPEHASTLGSNFGGGQRRGNRWNVTRVGVGSRGGGSYFTLSVATHPVDRDREQLEAIQNRLRKRAGHRITTDNNHVGIL
jgi:hypothetical protein